MRDMDRFLQIVAVAGLTIAVLGLVPLAAFSWPWACFGGFALFLVAALVGLWRMVLT